MSLYSEIVRFNEKIAYNFARMLAIRSLLKNKKYDNITEKEIFIEMLMTNTNNFKFIDESFFTYENVEFILNKIKERDNAHIRDLYYKNMKDVFNKKHIRSLSLLKKYPHIFPYLDNPDISEVLTNLNKTRMYLDKIDFSDERYIRACDYLRENFIQCTFVFNNLPSSYILKYKEYFIKYHAKYMLEKYGECIPKESIIEFIKKCVYYDIESLELMWRFDLTEDELLDIYDYAMKTNIESIKYIDEDYLPLFINEKYKK